MGFRAACGPVIRTVLFVAYGLFFAVGILLLALGAYYYSQIESADQNIAGAIGIIGLFMMLVAAIAAYSAHGQHQATMAIVFIVDIALFFGLVACCIIGYILAMGINDPIEQAVVNVYKPTIFKIAQWDIVVLSLNLVGDKAAPKTCRTLHDALKTSKTQSWNNTAWSAHNEREFAGNCTKSQEMLSKHIGDTCKQCWMDVEDQVISNIKEGIWPAALFSCFLLAFALCATLYNCYVLETGKETEYLDEDSNGIPHKEIGIIFAGGVTLFGLLAFIFGIIQYMDLTDPAVCPSGDCTNWAVMGIIFVGAIFLILGLLHLTAMFVGHVTGRLILRVVNIVYMVMTLVLLIATIFLLLVAGAITSVTTEYDLHFATIRKNVEHATPHYCKMGGVEGGLPLSDEACKEKIKEDTKSQIKTLAIVLTFLNVGVMVVIYVTLEAIMIWRDDPDGGGDGGDDDDYDYDYEGEEE